MLWGVVSNRHRISGVGFRGHNLFPSFPPSLLIMALQSVASDQYDGLPRPVNQLVGPLNASEAIKLQCIDRSAPKRMVRSIEQRPCSAVLVSSGCTSGDANPAAVARRSRAGRDPIDTLKGPVSDISAVFRLCCVKQITVLKMLNDIPGPTSRAVLQAIEALFQSDSENCLLVFSGHGNRADGAWCFKEAGSITPAQISELWANRARPEAHRMLYIVSDSCYSGLWVENLVQPTVFVQASASRDELCSETLEGGDFTLRWISHNQDEPVPQDDEELDFRPVCTDFKSVRRRSTPHQTYFSRSVYSFRAPIGLAFFDSFDAIQGAPEW